MNCVANATWRQLRDEDDGAVTKLIRRCHRADGGLPLSVALPLLRAGFSSGRSVGAFAENALIAAASVGARNGEYSAVGMVDPDHRGRGLGTRLMEWTLDASGRPLTVASEMVTTAARALYAKWELVPSQEELVMRRELPTSPEIIELPGDLQLAPWSTDRAPLFFAAYVAAFQDRPGFPGWSQQEWIEWTTGDDDFRADLSVVALDRQRRPLGFVTVAADWIVQLGVAPEWRARGLGTALVASALRGIHWAGFNECWLTVATNNVGAGRLYERSGFSCVGLRGKYRTE
jgi:mycothiol synthase